MFESFYFDPLIGNSNTDLWAVTEKIKICNNDCLYLSGILPTATIIYSHGSKGNIYCRRDILMDLRYQSGCSVLAYDPPGYGNTPGIPSLESWIGALRNIIDKVSGDIILYGESLGGCINSAVYEEFSNRIILVIHQDSLYSIRNTFEFRFPLFKCFSCLLTDINPSEIYENSIRCPIIIVHSIEDSKVPYQGALDLYNEISGVVKYFINSKDKHCEFPLDVRGQVFRLIYRIVTGRD
jgi:predicted alpha/beta hydrolase family esterase